MVLQDPCKANAACRIHARRTLPSGCQRLRATLWLPPSACHPLAATLCVPPSGCHPLRATLCVPLSACRPACHPSERRLPHGEAAQSFSAAWVAPRGFRRRCQYVNVGRAVVDGYRADGECLVHLLGDPILGLDALRLPRGVRRQEGGVEGGGAGAGSWVGSWAGRTPHGATSEAASQARARSGIGA